jgi:hypothetical protein
MEEKSKHACYGSQLEYYGAVGCADKATPLPFK